MGPGHVREKDVVLSIARSLNLEVVAEGVENETQLGFLERHGCDLVQGELFSMPVAAEALPALLESERLVAIMRPDLDSPEAQPNLAGAAP